MVKMVRRDQRKLGRAGEYIVLFFESGICSHGFNPLLLTILCVLQ